MREDLAEHAAQLKGFVDHIGGGIIESTFYSKTTSGPSKLYNVVDSTDDPYPQKPTKVTGWKSLLESQGFTKPCYATAPLPAQGKGPSHPGFDVGGHMTTKADGKVENGTCYLVPLCKWHNNSNNTAQFTMRSTTMLILTGYVQKDTGATFLARLGGNAPYALAYLGEEGPDYHYLAEPPSEAKDALALPGHPAPGLPGHYVLLRREDHEGRPVYRIEDARID